MSKIDRLISEQVHSWSIRDARAKEKKELRGDWPAITISREFGAKGRSLAKALNKRVGFKVWDKELLSAIADEAGADEKFLASLDERRRKVIEDTLMGSFMGSKLSNAHYLRSLNRVVQTISAHGKAIIVGRGANFIIKSPDVLRIRLVCPLELRIPRIAEQEGISEKEAKKLILTRDKEREDFIRLSFKKEAGKAQEFDLIINTGPFDISSLTDLVLLAYEKKIGKSIPVHA